MRANLEHGRVTSLLPYLLQDRYDRTLVPRAHPVAVLENDRYGVTAARRSIRTKSARACSGVAFMGYR